MARIARSGVLGVTLVVGAVCIAAAPRTSRTDLRDDLELRRNVEEQGRRFVDASNAVDPDLRRRTAREIFVPSALDGDGEARIVSLFDRIHSEFGVLQFHHAEAVVFGEGEGSRLSLHAYAKSAKDGHWHDLQFILEPAPPHRIRSIAFIAEVAEPIYLPNGDMTEASTRRWLDGYVDRLVADEDLAGGLLVVQRGSVLYQRWFGHADSARQHALGPHTRFSMGSGGKMFTALLVARLVDRGRLRFSDTLSQVLPAVRDHDFARRITMAQLLSHTSGVGEYWTDDYTRRRGEIRTLSDYLPFVLAVGIRFAPGERFEYSNSNYILLGLVLEAITGKPYDAVLHEELLKPLGMRDTGLFPFDDRDTLQAVPLRRSGKGWAPAGRGVKGSPAGGCLTTMPDMLKFASALAAGKIVPPDMLTQMTATKTAGLPDSPQSYGYGFILAKTRGGVASYGHGGITSGVNFEFRRFAPSDIVLVMFSNQDNGAYDDLRRNTTKLITGER